MVLHLALLTRRWTIAFAAHKLTARRKLPGAFTYDEVAMGFLSARRAGADARALLPAAMSASLLLNSPAGAQQFADWCTPSRRTDWERLIRVLDVAPDEWLRYHVTDREEVLRCASALAPKRAGLAMVTKVLALLCDRMVPGMQDAVVAFLLGEQLPLASPDGQTREVRDLPRALDRFAIELVERAPQLVAFIRELELDLTPAQALDRLFWFESCGYSHFHDGTGVGWWWVADEGCEAIVPVGESCGDELLPGARIELKSVRDVSWRKAAREALIAATQA